MVIAQGENILIVDDEETIRRVLNMKLSKEGYRCGEAGSADQALSQLKVNPFELVVMDINMPGKLGSEALPEMRAKFPQTAVVMASGLTDTTVIVRCIKDGAQDYIRKPFSLNEVLLSVGRALEKRRLELQIREYQQGLAQKVTEEKTTETRKYFLSAIETLINALEANDRYTAGHSRSVSNIALAVGQQLHLSAGDLEDLHWGSLLHDIGKIAVDPQILNKPGKLTPDEYQHIMTHAIVGPDLVRPLVNDRVVNIILHHHDNYDGSGADQTLSGEAIPLGARIVLAADAFDAMTSDRPYRAALPREQALEEVSRCSGTQFDPLVTGALFQVVGTRKIAARV
ncbi:MAG: response regulator [Chloroflexota bacterium]|nr:response regulator [Chloroflexota bacterium]